MNREQAMDAANRETNEYIRRQGFSAWQVENEPAIEQEVSAFWNEVYREACYQEEEN
jgi:hypothetical protein